MSDAHSSAATEEYQRCMGMLGDVPGATLEDRLTHYIGSFMALQIKATAEPQTLSTPHAERIEAERAELWRQLRDCRADNDVLRATIASQPQGAGK